MKTLTIAYLYREELNLYGDTGNVEILVYRAEKRGFKVKVLDIGVGDKVPSTAPDIVFMGGGPDSGQKDMYEDLVKSKKKFLKDFIEGGGVGLFICGSYQLLGNYYKASDGSVLKGLGIFDLYTEHPGEKSERFKRLIGNTVATLPENLLQDPAFLENNFIGNTLVGFENHGGRTFLADKSLAFAEIKKGNGNNGKDKTEGFMYKNAIGTYFHGPILSRNPHLADYLIAKSLGLKGLGKLGDTLLEGALPDDALVEKAHKFSLKLKP